MVKRLRLRGASAVEGRARAGVGPYEWLKKIKSCLRAEVRLNGIGRRRAGHAFICR
jgi:hypothetical protein